MNKLEIVNNDGKLLVNSRQVALMIYREHGELLKTIRQYCDYLGQGNFTCTDFFIETTYLSEQNKILPCYSITKKGCDMVANKMTGEKGILFTATYVTEFENMQNQLMKPMCMEDMMINQLQNMKEVRLQLEQNTESIKQLEAKIINIPTDYFTIAGYASLRGIKVDVSKANLLGRKGAKLSRQNGYDIGKVYDSKFGQVNTYHLDILKELF